MKIKSRIISAWFQPPGANQPIEDMDDEDQQRLLAESLVAKWPTVVMPDRGE